MPKRWSPRTLVHTVLHCRPNGVWGLVLPGEVATEVVVRLKVPWLKGNQPLKFTAVNLAVKQYSTEVRLEANVLSGRFRLGRTIVLVIMEGFGSMIITVA